MLQADVSFADLQLVCDRLSDAAQVAKSKQLPFRYLSAYREVEQVRNTGTSALILCHRQGW